MSDTTPTGKSTDRRLASTAPVRVPPSVLDAINETFATFRDVETTGGLIQRLEACGYGSAAVWVRQHPYKTEPGVKHGFTTWRDDR